VWGFTVATSWPVETNCIIKRQPQHACKHYGTMQEGLRWLG